MKTLLLLLTATILAAQPQRIPIVFDTDIGNDIDDALTLAFLLQSPELDVRSVTTSRFDSHTRARLAAKILNAYNRAKVPLASGSPEALLHKQFQPPTPQFQALSAEDKLPDSAMHTGVQLIIDTLLRAEKKLNVVAVGPLTNVALALKTDPRIKDRIERIALMGGAVDLQTAETNIVNDIAAAAVVFESGVPVLVAPFDVTRELHFTGADLQRLRDSAAPTAKLLVRLLELWQTWRVGRDPTLHDALPLIALLHPEWCTFEDGRIEVEVTSPITRGITKFTPASRLPKGAKPNVRVIRSVDKQRMLDLFAKRVSAPPLEKQP
jgi:inosine-uridine nucleoside N-ribohydrolase